MLSQVFNRSTAIRRNSFGYRPTRLFATCSAFPCKVCLIRVSQVKGSVHGREGRGRAGTTPGSSHASMGATIFGDFELRPATNPLFRLPLFTRQLSIIERD